eukprot:1158871-Pelagomonas_calceolata.AAC.4
MARHTAAHICTFGHKTWMQKSKQQRSKLQPISRRHLQRYERSIPWPELHMRVPAAPPPSESGKQCPPEQGCMWLDVIMGPDLLRQTMEQK